MRGPLKKPARFSGSFCKQVEASYNKEGGIVILWKEGTISGLHFQVDFLTDRPIYGRKLVYLSPYHL